MTSAPAPDGFMKDAQGRLVPLALVKPQHKLEDELVRDLHAAAVEVSAALRAFRDKAAADISAYLSLLAEQYQTTRGGAKGNLTLTSYDGTLRIQVAINDQLSFGPELQVAKNLIDQCLHEWSLGANEKLIIFIKDAFAVDKEGKLNVGKILMLRRSEIDDDRWRRAMAAISDAIRVESCKEYLRLYKRAKPDQKFDQVPLDLASV